MVGVQSFEVGFCSPGQWLHTAIFWIRSIPGTRVLERQQERLLEVYLGEVIKREEFERKRKELNDTQNALQRQLRQLEAQVQKQLDVVEFSSRHW